MLALLKEVWLTAKKALTTLSGVLISFTLQQPKKAKKLVLSYLPQQDLNGYSKPWLGGNGKNYIDINATRNTSTVSWSVNDNTITLTAETATDGFTYIKLSTDFMIFLLADNNLFSLHQLHYSFVIINKHSFCFFMR